MSKKNAEYWAERFKDLEKAQNGMAAKTVKSINASYDRAIHQVQKEIDAWYQRFAKNNQITYAEARKRLNSKELKELQWDVKEYIKYGKDNELNQQWIKELENASAKVHISRLQALELNIRQAVEKVTADQENKTAAVLSDVYETGYYHTAYEIAKGLQIGSDIGRLDERAINNILHKPWAPDGKNFSDRIWENKNKLLNTIHQELSQNIMTGADPQKAIDVIGKKMMTSKYNAGRLVMTEEAYFNSLSQGDMFKELDVEKYEIVATLDSHTSEICQDMDGKVFPMSEYESGVTAPPFHVYCRSTTAPWFPDNYGEVGERAARNSDDDKTYHVPADMSYDEWYKKFVENDDKSDLKTEPDDGTIKVTRDYDSSMAKSFGKKHYDAMRDLVDKCKNKTLAKLWDKYESQITVRSANYKKTAHCSGTNISLDIEADAKARGCHEEYGTAFHESGHALDHIFRGLYQPNMPFHYSALYKSGVFPQTIIDEVNELVNEKATIIKQEWKDHAGDWEWLFNKGYIDAWSYRSFQQWGSWSGREPKYSKSMAYKAVEDEIKVLDLQSKGDISDMMEGATSGKIQAGVGHGKLYWSKRKTMNDGLATEAFAEMTCATISSEKSLAMIKKYFPKSYALYEEMLEEIAKM